MAQLLKGIKVYQTFYFDRDIEYALRHGLLRDILGRNRPLKIGNKCVSDIELGVPYQFDVLELEHFDILINPTKQKLKYVTKNKDNYSDLKDDDKGFHFVYPQMGWEEVYMKYLETIRDSKEEKGYRHYEHTVFSNLQVTSRTYDIPQRVIDYLKVFNMTPYEAFTLIDSKYRYSKDKTFLRYETDETAICSIYKRNFKLNLDTEFIGKYEYHEEDKNAKFKYNTLKVSFGEESTDVIATNIKYGTEGMFRYMMSDEIEKYMGVEFIDKPCYFIFAKDVNDKDLLMGVHYKGGGEEVIVNLTEHISEIPKEYHDAEVYNAYYDNMTNRKNMLAYSPPVYERHHEVIDDGHQIFNKFLNGRR